jgi:hypothetical protein
MTEPTNDDHLEDRLRGYLERFTSYQPRRQSAYGTEFSTPSGSDLATALGDATTSAHDDAVAAATASGVHLGKVSGLTSSPPSLCYGASGERLVVTVILTYGISP